MNITNILKLADIIERQKHVETVSETGFNMSTYWHPCGTPSCIAGFAASQGGYANMDGWTFRGGMAWLGLDETTAARLFSPTELYLTDVTPAMAAWTLRNLAETGEVLWRLS